MYLCGLFFGYLGDSKAVPTWWPGVTETRNLCSFIYLGSPVSVVCPVLDCQHINIATSPKSDIYLRELLQATLFKMVKDRHTNRRRLSTNSECLFTIQPSATDTLRGDYKGILSLYRGLVDLT